MDTFIDKLANKLTAQDMIKANTAADEEEKNRLREQVQEYRGCLQEMQTVNKNLQETSALFSRSMQENDAQIKAMQQTNSQMTRSLQETSTQVSRSLQDAGAQMNKNLQETSAQVNKNLQESTVLMNRNLQEASAKMNKKLEETSAQMSELSEKTIVPQIEKIVNESIAKIKNVNVETNNNAELKQLIEDKMGSSAEMIHRECVKVYRNVQAVIVEENRKLDESVSASMNLMKKKLDAIFAVSIVALVAAVGGLLLQILVYLQII